VTNAIKFTDPPGTIVVSAREVDSEVRLSVSDTGIGISEHDVARVFTPFFQVEQGPTRRYGGLGLGLAIVRDIADGMNADVEIESIVGKGTVVSVVLPRMEIVAPALAG
jgi:signal transduction histidine kinase